MSQDRKAQKKQAEPSLFDAKAPGSLGLQAWAQDQEEFCCDEAKETWWGEGWKIGAMRDSCPAAPTLRKHAW